VQEEASRMAELSAASAAQIVEGARQMLRSLAYTEQVRTMNAAGCNTLFAELLRQSLNFNNIGLTARDGLTIASAVPMKEATYLNERPWFERFQEQRDFSLGEYQIGKITGKPNIIMSYPLPEQPGDKPLVAIYAALDLESLQSCISRPKITPQTVMAIVDRNGVELARNLNSAKWVGKKLEAWPKLQATTLNTKAKFVEATGVDGVRRLYTSVMVPGSDNGLFVIVGVTKDELLASIQADFDHSLLMLGVFTLATLACAWFFAGISVLRNVKQLTAASRRLAEGKWDTEIPLRGGAREIRQLASAFHEMAASLRQHSDRLEELVEQRTLQLSRANDSLSEEIEERKQAEAVSEKLLANLERSNKELEQFAYVASHDLQEPLRLVSAYTQLLLQRYRDKLDADADPIVRFINEGVNRMKQLIHDLLAYSRVSSQESAFSFTDAETVLDTVLCNLRMPIREHEAVITHDPLPALLCDPSKLGQLFQNLIGNGLKFRGTEAPRIHVGARKTDDAAAWLFSVSDNGVGIDPEYFERIFVIFQRLHTRAKYPGTGIGLAICKRIVEHHGGKIWVNSGKGKGCTFYFTIAINPRTL